LFTHKNGNFPGLAFIDGWQLDKKPQIDNMLSFPITITNSVGDNIGNGNNRLKV
jgi:hypothetical protein